MKICKNCNSVVSDSENFCSLCGGNEFESDSPVQNNVNNTIPGFDPSNSNTNPGFDPNNSNTNPGFNPNYSNVNPEPVPTPNNDFSNNNFNNMPNNNNNNNNNNFNNAPNNNQEDSGSIGWLFLGLFQPLIGFVLFLVWKNQKPRCAKKALTGCIIGVIIYVVFVVCYVSVLIPLILEDTTAELALLVL